MMGDESETFLCGHRAAGENLMSDGRGGHRCRECHRARSLEHYREQARKQKPKEPSGLHFDNAMHERGMEVSSNRLLIALYHSHLYVFDAAERSGRLVVRP